jgi:hypothetical protein
VIAANEAIIPDLAVIREAHVTMRASVFDRVDPSIRGFEESDGLIPEKDFLRPFRSEVSNLFERIPVVPSDTGMKNGSREVFKHG